MPGRLASSAAGLLEPEDSDLSESESSDVARGSVGIRPKAMAAKPAVRPSPLATASLVAYPVVYDWCMSMVRTNIEIEDSYVRTIMDRYGLQTKKAAVGLALRHLAGQPMTRDEALAMQGAHAIGQPPVDVPPRKLT
jgi:Arc/MetJ family transcription regulator